MSFTQTETNKIEENYEKVWCMYRSFYKNSLKSVMYVSKFLQEFIEKCDVCMRVFTRIHWKVWCMYESFYKNLLKSLMYVSKFLQEFDENKTISLWRCSHDFSRSDVICDVFHTNKQNHKNKTNSLWRCSHDFSRSDVICDVFHTNKYK